MICGNRVAGRGSALPHAHAFRGISVQFIKGGTLMTDFANMNFRAVLQALLATAAFVAIAFLNLNHDIVYGIISLKMF